MIDQNTVVRVRYGNQQEINLGNLSVFEYLAPQSAGRIVLTFSKTGVGFDKADVAELIHRVRGTLELVIVSDTTTDTYTVMLEELKIQSGSNWELLKLTTVRL